MMPTRPRLAAVVLILAIAAITAVMVMRTQGTSETADAPALQLGPRTKTEGCATLGPLPDRACTPGAVFSAVSAEQVCQRGYARSVRDVPDAVKTEVYAEYGIATHRTGQYEVDHLVSLELGGSNDIANLWPEAAESRPGYHEKDRFENFLHDQVCARRMSLSDAQGRIATDWLKNWESAGRP